MKTRISIGVPDGWYGGIAVRSGLRVKRFIDVGAGAIISEYRGGIRAILYNHSNEDLKVKLGYRIARFVLKNLKPYRSSRLKFCQVLYMTIKDLEILERDKEKS